MPSLHCYDFWKKFLTKVEFKCTSHQWKVSAMNSVHAELIEDYIKSSTSLVRSLYRSSYNLVYKQ